MGPGSVGMGSSRKGPGRDLIDDEVEACKDGSRSGRGRRCKGSSGMGLGRRGWDWAEPAGLEPWPMGMGMGSGRVGPDGDGVGFGWKGSGRSRWHYEQWGWGDVYYLINYICCILFFSVTTKII